MVRDSPPKHDVVSSRSVRKTEVIWPAMSSNVTIRSRFFGVSGSQAWVEPSCHSSMPGSGRRSRFLRCTPRRAALRNSPAACNAEGVPKG